MHRHSPAGGRPARAEGTRKKPRRRCPLRLSHVTCPSYDVDPAQQRRMALRAGAVDMLILIAERWVQQARCSQAGVDREAFYAGRQTRREEVRAALALCTGCPVRGNCLQNAVDNNDAWGIWGGTTATQRRSMRRRGRVNVEISRPRAAGRHDTSEIDGPPCRC